MREEQLDLINAYCSGEISDEQFKLLEEELRQDPDFRKVFLEYRGLDSALRTACDSGALGVPSINEVESKPVPQNLLVVQFIRIAAICLLAFGMAYLLQPSSTRPIEPSVLEDNGVAVFMRSLDAELEGAVYQEGDTVPPGRLKLKQGYVELEFYSGASVVLEGPAELEIHSKDGGVLLHGKLRAQVPEHAHGFTITSQDVQLVDLGTSFGMSVGDQKGTQVQVFDGKVEIFSPDAELNAGEGLELSAGEGRRLHRSAGEGPIEVDASLYLSSDELERKANVKSLSGYAEWESDISTANEKDDLLVRYGFVKDLKQRRQLSNYSNKDFFGIEGSIIGARWSEGRWPQKHALDFKRPGDRVRIQVDGTYESMTLSTWVRIDGFDNKFNSLMLSDGWHRLGAVHWQILKEGMIELAVFLGDKVNNNSRAPFVVEPSDFGRWIHIATIYDGANGLVHHYRDGESIGIVKLKRVVPLQIKQAELGNWTTPRKKEIRNFNGRMDDFAIYSRVMSPQEIKGLFERGRP